VTCFVWICGACALQLGWNELKHQDVVECAGHKWEIGVTEWARSQLRTRPPPPAEDVDTLRRIRERLLGRMDARIDAAIAAAAAAAGSPPPAAEGSNMEEEEGAAAAVDGAARAGSVAVHTHAAVVAELARVRKELVSAQEELRAIQAATLPSASGSA